MNEARGVPVVVVAPARPPDCPRGASCSGGMLAMGGERIATCGLLGCKHNHNPTHGGCGVDLRSSWGLSDA